MSYARALGQLAEYESHENGRDAMDIPWDAIRTGVETIKDIKDAIDDTPELTRTHLRNTAKALWPLLKQRQFEALIRTALMMLAPKTYHALSTLERRKYLGTLARLAGARIGLPPPGQKLKGDRPGFSDVQVKAYHRRQKERGRIPGQANQRRQREWEMLSELIESEFNEDELEFELIGAEYAVGKDRLKTHDPQGTGKKSKGRHQKGESRKIRETTKADKRDAASRKQARARLRARALELTGSENPTDEDMLRRMRQLDDQIQGTSDDEERRRLIALRRRIAQLRLDLK